MHMAKLIFFATMHTTCRGILTCQKIFPVAMRHSLQEPNASSWQCDMSLQQPCELWCDPTSLHPKELTPFPSYVSWRPAMPLAETLASIPVACTEPAQFQASLGKCSQDEATRLPHPLSKHECPSSVWRSYWIPSYHWSLSHTSRGRWTSPTWLGTTRSGTFHRCPTG